MKLLDDKKFAIPIFILFLFFMFYEPIVCFIILGTLVSITSIYYWRFLTYIYKNGTKASGKILSYESDSEGYKTPIISFTTEQGIQIREKPYYHASTDLGILMSYKKEIGRQIDILHDPENPEKFVIKKEKGFNKLTLIFMALIGLIFLIIGIFNIF